MLLMSPNSNLNYQDEVHRLIEVTFMVVNSLTWPITLYTPFNGADDMAMLRQDLRTCKRRSRLACRACWVPLWSRWPEACWSLRMLFAIATSQQLAVAQAAADME